MTNKKATQTTFKKDCHKGNTAVYKETNGGTLYIGGWNNAATFDWNTHVIDLTGNEHRFWDVPVAFDAQSQEFMPFLMKAYAGWLSLPFPDFGVPAGMKTLEQWKGIAQTIKNILQKGNDVLVACHGGHGRSGLFVAIVGHILHDGKNGWKSPVEKVRTIHCVEAVETYAQEKYVYDILGLRIKVAYQMYEDDDPYFGYGRGSVVSGGVPVPVGQVFKACPICGTESLYTEKWGFCMTCRNAHEKNAPVVDDLTLEDIATNGKVAHTCTNEKCLGIWTASKCGHTTHDQIIYEGLCEECYKKMEDDAAYAEKMVDAGAFGECAMCHAFTSYGKDYGVCYECAEKLTGHELVSQVHNSITDPYVAVSHSCDADHQCVGVIQADVCKHVIHNREVEDGLCPLCLARKEQQEVK